MTKVVNKSVKIVTEVTDITCDACGVSVVPEVQKTYQENLNDFNAFGVLKAAYGYGSSQDGESFNFDLCETCFRELVNKVKELRNSHGLN
ncbi:hypothetical protein [uncultured Idiomarina sp.]|uniref:hypothetical protein n=1 Tax=uncultured Idiomarina sp. TaxID=352961 RepID=UPI002595FDD6|nr:hypothetical protein [uncultured Idiomarina sp.]